ncbi:MAG: tyrosine-type recombinase/integrase [Acidobacteria bacterium]|nr:tyrosine-type recombinase/integrase [Acidobacteriota bacterium]
MAKSHQRGTIRLEHNSWVGYMNLKVLDPTTRESKWRKQRIGVLGAKSKMTKHQAQDSLDEKIAQKTGGTIQPRADERIVTLAWFTRNRFFPLREGSTWKEGTAINRKSAIEQDILAKLGDVPMAQIDKFVLQTHLNHLATTLSAGRVMHARFYMKAIFEEAIDQEFVQKNPTRKLILPKELRPVDKTTLTWDELRRLVASVPLRDRILLTLDMTETFRPSELFALCWSGFDMDRKTLTVSQTVYRGKLRDYGKTRKSLRTVHVPEGLANDLWLWKQECPDPSPEAFIFPNSRKRNGEIRNGFIRTENYRARVLKTIETKLGLPKLNFQVLRRTIATLVQTKGSIKDVQSILGHSKADTTVNVYMQEIEATVKQTQAAIYSELMTPRKVEAVS